MKTFIFLTFFCFLFLLSFSQTIRVLDESYISKNASEDEKNLVQTLRIDTGHIWLNGNRIAKKDLPPSLQTISREYKIKASFNGIAAYELQINGIYYMVKNGKIMECPKECLPNSSSSKQHMEKYYSGLKNEDPKAFEELNREAQLLQRSQQLAKLYTNTTQSSLRMQYGEELRAVLSELFDLSIHNQQEELENLEKQIGVMKEELNLRKENKNKSVAKRFQELTGSN